MEAVVVIKGSNRAGEVESCAILQIQLTEQEAKDNDVIFDDQVIQMANEIKNFIAYIDPFTRRHIKRVARLKIGRGERCVFKLNEDDFDRHGQLIEKKALKIINRVRWEKFGTK